MLGEPRHLDAGDDQEGAEDVEQPVELADQPAAREDHDRAQHDRADDAVQQYAALQFQRHREEAEDHHPHEDVVDRQRLLDQVAGDEGGRLLVGQRTSERAVEVPPQPGGEQHRHRHPGERPARRFLQRHPVLLAAAEGEQVHQQHRHHDGGKGRPHPPRSDRFHRALRTKTKRACSRRTQTLARFNARTLPLGQGLACNGRTDSSVAPGTGRRSEDRSAVLTMPERKSYSP